MKSIISEISQELKSVFRFILKIGIYLILFYLIAFLLLGLMIVLIN